jgi:prolyl-tRNA synthetase
MVMGCYGIGVARTMAAAIEQNSDENGIIWPVQIAPFQVTILPLNFNHALSMQTAEDLYQKLLAQGIETLLDDRDERAGIKFKDADLIGIPVQVIIGEKSLTQGKVEIKRRSNGEKSVVSVEEVLPEIKKILAALAV